jgi:hypothetical protein
MSDHRFQIGETVEFTNGNVIIPRASETCEILRLLSTDGDDPQYRIKVLEEGFERVARESQLRALEGETAKASA